MPDPSPTAHALRMRVAVRSDIGMRRATNQDAVVATPSPTGEAVGGDHLLMVADGMGAHAAGELASKMATQSAPLAYEKSLSESAPDALRRAIHKANALIHAKGQSAPEFHGMGTTCSCLVATQGAALIGHVGDSRVYRLRGGTLEQLTRDHSLVWEMAAASNVTEDKVPACIPKNVITRSLGPHESVSVDLEGPHPLAVGDVFLLCSDGLTGVVSNALAAGVLSAMPPDEAVDALVNLANLLGGPDNVSVIVARVENGAPAASPKPTPEVSGRWFTSGVAVACALACGWLSMNDHLAAAVVSAMGFAAAVTYTLAGRGWLARMGGGHSAAPTNRDLSGSFGDGPYSKTECGDLSKVSADLRALLGELAALDQARSEDDPSLLSPPADGRISWDPFLDRQREADAAHDRGDHREAIAKYARLATAVMESARRA